MGKAKELGKDSQGVQKSMTKLDFLADGVGQMPLNIISGLIGQLTYFYTEKAGLAAGAVATMLMLAKIADAFSDLVMGKIMDSTKSKSGERCRPWFIRMLFPVIVIIIAMFTVPKANSTVQLAYVLITNILASAVIYTAVSIPFSSIMAIRTASVEERGTMGVVRAVCGYIFGMFIAVGLVPATNALGGDQAAWIKVAVVLALCAGLALLFLYRKSKENVKVTEENLEKEADEDDNIPFGEALGYLFHNKYWVIMLLVGVFMNISYGLGGSGGTYYANYILGNDNLIALIGIVTLVPTIIGFAVTAPLAKKFGMARTCMSFCVVGIAANIVRAIFPYSLVVCMIGSGISQLANIPMMCLIGAMVNNCVVYNEWKYGKKLLGMTNSANSFGTKVGSGIGGSLIGWMLQAAGYKASLEIQPSSVNTAIIGFSIYIPLALFVILGILMYKYDLEKDYGKFVEEVNAKKAKQDNQ